MKETKAAQVLSRYNKWRRGTGRHQQPDPLEVGEAIDVAVAALKGCKTRKRPPNITDVDAIISGE